MRRRRIVLGIAIALVLCAGGGAGAWYWRARAGAAVDPSKGYTPKPVSELKGPYFIINTHEHIQGMNVAWRILKAMDDLSIEMTLIVGSSKQTVVHAKKFAFEGYDENTEEVLRIAKRWPDRFIPFATIKPGDPDNDQKVAAWAAKGARGLKLYTGHSTFYDLKERQPDGTITTHRYPLDDPSMMPAFRWCAEHDFPILWHVNMGQYETEFRRVMDQFPDMIVICPHHCMLVGQLDRLRQLMHDYPRLYIDLSHGYHEYMAQALRSVSAHREDYRKLYDEFSDRIMWGTDTVITKRKEKTPEWIEQMARSYFGLFGDAEFDLPNFNADYHLLKTEHLPGMKLPPSLLKKIYQDNPHRLFKLDHHHTN